MSRMEILSFLFGMSSVPRLSGPVGASSPPSALPPFGIAIDPLDRLLGFADHASPPSRGEIGEGRPLGHR